MRLFQPGIIFLLILCASSVIAQDTSFGSFISSVSEKYHVDVALAPELIPALDSIQQSRHPVTGIEDFLQQILMDKNVTYQILDGNKILLRRENNLELNQGKILIEGTIIDSQSQLPLPYGAVTISGTPHGTYTDDNGHFTLYVEDSPASLIISYLGYKPVMVPASDFIGKQKIVQMVVDNISLEQVLIIVPFYQMSSDAQTQALSLKGYQFISEDDLLHWSSVRLINHLTGYTQFSSEQGIRIRGSEEENSLIIMDGLPVYDPYHFYNIFSPFNGHYFSSVSLYKNNIPVEYGGRVDGMIDLSSSFEGQRSKLIFDTDLLMSSISADLVITKNIRFTAGGRISHTKLLNASLHDTASTNFTLPGKLRDENEWSSSQQPAFNFYDINLGIRAGLGKKNEIAFSYFKSSDYLDNLIVNAVSTTLQNHETISIRQALDSRDEWKNQGLSAGLQTHLNSHMSFHVNGFYSSFDKTISYNALLEEDFPMMDRESINTGYQNSILGSWGIKSFIKKYATGQSGYTLGLEFQQHEVDLIARDNTTTYLLEVQQEREATLFGEYKFAPGSNLDIAIGGRLTHLASTSDIYTQPNLRINYFLDDQWSVKSSFSKSIQVVRELTVENRFGREIEFLALSQPDAGYPVMSSDKYMIGAAYTSNHFNIDGEFYYKTTEGLMSVRAPRPDPTFQNQASPDDFYRLYTGEGWTAGLDLLAVFKFKKSETSVSYTLSKISQQFDHLFNGNSFSPTEDRRHQLKLSSQYKMGVLISSVLLTYKTKAPYISLIRLEGQGGVGMVDQGMVVRYLPPYFSLDLALDYSFRLAAHPAQVGISLINATNHANINDLQHIGRIPRESGIRSLFLTHETELLGRTFNVHFRYLLD